MTTEDIFSACQSLDELFALVLDQDAGPEALQGLLAKLVASDVVHRENLERAAEKMAAAGLPQADMVLEVAGQARTHAEIEIEKILDDPYPANIKARLSWLYKEGEITAADMEQAGVDPEIMASATNIKPLKARKR